MNLSVEAVQGVEPLPLADGRVPKVMPRGPCKRQAVPLSGLLLRNLRLVYLIGIYSE